MSVEAFSFGLTDGKVAVWTANQVYGTAVDVESINMADVMVNTVTGQLEGDDQITDVHARQISLRIRLRFAFKSLSVWAILSGETVVDSTTTKSIVITPLNRPYFSFAGRVDHTQGGGDMQIFVPKAKITGDMGWSMQYGQYVTPEMEAIAVSDGAPYYFGKLIQHATAQAVTIPIT